MGTLRLLPQEYYPRVIHLHNAHLVLSIFSKVKLQGRGYRGDFTGFGCWEGMKVDAEGKKTIEQGKYALEFGYIRLKERKY